MAQATTMRVYVGHVPNTIQVFVHPGGVAVDYLDEGGNFVGGGVIDAASVGAVASQNNYTVVYQDAKGNVTSNVDVAPPEPEVSQPAPTRAFDANMTVAELRAAAKEAGITGTSGMKKAELVEALNG